MGFVSESIIDDSGESINNISNMFDGISMDDIDNNNFNNITDGNFSSEMLDSVIDDLSTISSNFSGPMIEDYTPYYTRPETYIVPIVFAIIFVVGVLGNGTLVIVFLRHRAMRNVPNTYILSLALADLLVIITCVPFTSTVYTVESWPWGESLCTISETAKDISVGVSVFTLTALSADRFFAIVDPMRRLHTSGGGKRATRFTIITAVLIWILAIICSIPAAAGSYVRVFQVNPETEFLVCYPYPEEWGPQYPRLIVLLRFLLYYALPLAVIAIFYVLMARHLVLSAKNVPGELRGAHRQVRARRKVAVTVLAFVVIFAICFLPYHVTMMWFYYSPTSQEDYNAFWHILRIVGFCLSFVNSCVNPVALYCVSGAFRKHFNRYLLCKKASSRELSHTRRGDSLSLTNTRRTICRASTNRRNMATSIRRDGHETSVTVMGNGNMQLHYNIETGCSKM